MKQRVFILPPLPRLLALLSVGVVATVARAQEATPRSVQVFVWSFYRSAPYSAQDDNGYRVTLESTVTPLRPADPTKVYAVAAGIGDVEDRLDLGAMQMEPGKTYFVSLTGHPYLDSGSLFLAPPPGYYIEIEGEAKNRLDSGGDIFDATVRVLPKRSAPVQAAGTASNIRPGKVNWAISLGRLKDGTSAGELTLVDAAFWPAADWSRLLTPSILSYESTSETDMSVHRDAGVIRQILGNEAIVDIVPMSPGPGFEIRFYTPGQQNEPLTLPRTFTGQPFVTYRVEQGDTATSLEFTREFRPVSGPSGNPAVTRREIATLVRTGTWPTFQWTSKNWTLEGHTALTETVETSTGTEAHRSSETLVRESPTSAPALRINRNHALKPEGSTNPWGEAIVSETFGSGVQSLTTSYEYYEDRVDIGSFGFIKLARFPGAGWQGFKYSPVTLGSSNMEWIGVPIQRFGPFSQAPENPPATLDWNAVSGAALASSFSNDPFGFPTRFSSVESKVGSQTNARSTTVHADGTETMAQANGRPLVRAETNDYANSSSSERTISYYFKEDTDAFFRRKLHSVLRADGVKLAYVYQRGYWNGETFALTPNNGCDHDFASEPPGPVGTRICVITGTVATGSLYATHAGYDIDDLRLVEGRSTLETTIRDNRGIVLRTQVQVWKDGAWNAVPLSRTDFGYDYIGRLTSINDNGGLHSFEYGSAYGYDLLTSETDAAGTQLSYTYDVAGRLKSITKTAAATIVTNALTTTFDYDAAGRVTAETISSSGQSETIVSRRQFDDAGRLTSTTPAGLSTTSYFYDVANRRQTVRAPDGGEANWTYLRDGRLESVTGSAVVPQYYSYDIDGTGQSVVQSRVGSANSPRTATALTDWRGRVVRTERPGFTGQPASVTQNFFDASGRLWKTTRSGYADVRYEYDDPFSALTRVGEHYGSGTNLSPGSSDRITDFSRGIEWLDNAWWLTTGTKTYPKDGLATDLVLNTARHRLSGFSASLRAEERTTDVDGNTTTSTFTVNRSAKQATVTTTRTGYSQPEIRALVNGLTASVTTHDGLIYTAGYDALQRPSISTHPRTGEVATFYYPGTNLVHRTWGPTNANGTNGNLAIVGYDSSGRVQALTNARGDVTRYGYDQAGRLIHQWGTATAPLEFEYDVHGQRRFMRTYRTGNPAPGAPLTALGAWWDTTWPANPPVADQTEWVYDGPTGLLSRKTHNSGSNSARSVDFEYNARGQLSRRLWARLLNPSASESPTNPRIAASYAYYGDAPNEPRTGELRAITYNDSTPGVRYSYNRTGAVAKVWDATSSDANDYREFIYHDLPAASGYAPQHLRLDAIQLSGFYDHKVLTMRYDGIFRSAGFYLGTGASQSAMSSDLAQEFGYNSGGRLEQVDTSRGNSSGTLRRFTYGYVSNSRLVETLTSGSYQVTNHYEPKRDLRDTIDSKWGATSRTRYDYTYNAAGQRETTSQSGDVFGDLGSIVSRHFYNGRGELIDSASYLGSVSGAQLSGRHFAFDYDAIGNRTSASRTGAAAAETFTPNEANQYDFRQNRYAHVAGTVANSGIAAVMRLGELELPIGRQGAYWGGQVPLENNNGPAQADVTITATQAATSAATPDTIRTETRPAWLPPATQQILYDADGNVFEDGVWRFSWDAENRLTGMRSLLSPAFTTRRLEVTFRYDYLGRRVEKQVHDLDGAVPDVVRRYLYDGWNLVAEFSLNAQPATLNLVRSYTWGLDTGGSLAPIGSNGALLQITEHGTGRSFLPTYDGSGNVASLLDASNGTPTARYEYSPFGEPLRSEGDYAKANPFRFATKFTDEETGLVYYGHRYYSPALGRFISRDPIAESGGINLYGFCGNDGVNRADVLGLQSPTTADKPTPPPTPPPTVVVLPRVPTIPPNGDVPGLVVRAVASANSTPVVAGQQGGIVSTCGVIARETVGVVKGFIEASADTNVAIADPRNWPTHAKQLVWDTLDPLGRDIHAVEGVCESVDQLIHGPSEQKGRAVHSLGIVAIAILTPLKELGILESRAPIYAGSSATGESFSVINTTRGATKQAGVRPLRTTWILADLRGSELGRKILAAAENDEIDLVLSNSTDVEPGLMGISYGRTAIAYVKNTLTYEETAVTLLHEGVHSLGIAGSRRAEALARIAELIHRGKTIDNAAMRSILNDMKTAQVYDDLPWQLNETAPAFPGWRF